MASEVKNRINCHMTAIMKTLDCAICLSIVKSPVSLGCGHFFCKFCISEVLKSNYRTPCPLCKRSFTRRSVENADQRNSIVLAVGKLALECGKITGANMVSPDTWDLLNDLDTICSSTSLSNERKEEPKPSKSRKRKSQEIVCEKVSHSRSSGANTEVKMLNSNVSPANGKIPQESNKRQRQSCGLSDEEFELPSLDEIIASGNKSKLSHQPDSNKHDVQESKLSGGSNKKSLKVSFADTPALSSDMAYSSNCEESISTKEPNEAVNNKETRNNRASAMTQSKRQKTSKLKEAIQNKKNALKNKTNQIISDGIENIINKTPGNKKSIDNPTKSPEDEKAKENINKKNLNADNSVSNERSAVPMSPKSSTKERPKIKTGKSRISKVLGEQEAMISKLKAAENFTLTVVNTKQTSNPTPMNVSEECYSLDETNLFGLRENAGDCRTDVVQCNEKEELALIPDTAVSVQSVVSPTANKPETLSKSSPGWSKVRQVGKDFRVRKFSKLPVEKNSSNSCQIESDVSEDTSEGSSFEMPKLIKISELQKDGSDAKNVGCDPVNDKCGFKQNNQDTSKLSLGQGTMTIAAEIHSQGIMHSDSNEKESSATDEGNKNFSSCDETETSVVNSNEINASALDESVLCNQNISDATKTVSDESIVNFNGSGIPSPDMTIIKPNVTKVKDLATDVSCAVEMELLNESEFSNHAQNTITDTFDSHMIDNDMDIGNDDHVLPVLDNEVRPYIKQMNKILPGLNMYNKQRSRGTKSSKLSPKFTSVSKSVTTGTKALFSEETVYFASHSQQTSQRLMEFCDDNSGKNSGTLVPRPAFGLSSHPFPKYAFDIGQNQVSPFHKLDSSEKTTKVLKRTCLTLDEIQDAFANCRNKRPVTICSLPFSSGEYRLDINVADETLNISVLKVDSYERPKETAEKSSTSMFAEKNIQTSISCPSSTTVLPSSNTDSENSQPENELMQPVKNLFPYLNQYFSDTDPSQQCDVLPEDNEDPLEVSEVLPYYAPNNPCDPEQEPGDKSDVVKSLTNLLSELQALPSKDFSLPDVRIVTERLSVYDKVDDDVESLSHSKKPVEALPTEDIARAVGQLPTDDVTDCDMKGNIMETLRPSNDLVVSCVSRGDESLPYEDLPPTQEAPVRGNVLEANKTNHQTSDKDHESTEIFKKQKEKEFANQSSKRNSSEIKVLKPNECVGTDYNSNTSPSQRQKIFPSSSSSVKKSKHLSYMDKYSPDDPDLAMVAELVGPLKELAEEMEASGNGPEETSLTCGERVGNQKRPLEVFEELVLSKNNQSPGNCQRASRLSLKSKGSSKKFKRIQRYSCSDDSDSDKEEITETSVSPENKEVLPSAPKDNGTTGSPNEHGVTHSFASDDLTTGNTTDIAMEIESLDEKIKSVLTKLKDIGREDLLDTENDVVSKLKDQLNDANDADSDDSQKSTDIFSVPPTPPDAVSDQETLKTSRWKN